jgi:hypothetical protein
MRLPSYQAVDRHLSKQTLPGEHDVVGTYIDRWSRHLMSEVLRRREDTDTSSAETTLSTG